MSRTSSSTAGKDLFSLIEDQIRAEGPKLTEEECPHHHEDKTLTVWPGETWERLTWTCLDCGRIRGRVK